jgi:hypothetical protein
MVYANASENSANAGMQVGDEKVDAYAEFDPKTGKLKAGYTVTTIKTPKKVTVKENEESDEIDLFPYDFLSCMAVPEGNLNVNDHFEVKAGMYTVQRIKMRICFKVLRTVNLEMEVSNSTWKVSVANRKWN